MILEDIFFSKKARIIELAFATFVFFAVQLSLYLIFMYVPNEAQMGAIQRIFYFHVGSAFACYISFGLVFIFSILWFVTRTKVYDVLNEAASEVGLLFCTITLVSGMIWAKTAWNVWFNWEPRLVIFLLLWLIFASLFVFRRLANTESISDQSAILGVIGSSTVPLVWVSVKLMPQIMQLHPQVVEKNGLRSKAFLFCFVFSSISLICLQFLLFYLRAKLGIIKNILSEYSHQN
jgi:heme exporter protein C